MIAVLANISLRLLVRYFPYFPGKTFPRRTHSSLARLFGGRTRSAAFHACLNSLHRRMTHSKYTNEKWRKICFTLERRQQKKKT